MSRAVRIALLAIAVTILTSVAAAKTARPPKAPKAPRGRSVAPVADSATIALWRFDENGGTRAADSGPARLDGIAGLDTHSEFGRYRSARRFERSVDSWVMVPYAPQFEGHEGFTIEAWVRVDSVALYEIQVIAARWSPVPNQQAWVFGVSGRNLAPPDVPLSPGWFRPLVGLAPAQRLVFGYQPLVAGAAIGFFSTSDLPLERWVHVAATVDGEVVRLFVDGQLDAQYATPGPIRPSEAPLVLGSAFDPRHLTSFGGDLRMDPNASITVYYPLVGALDEVRLSGLARSVFESAPLR